MFTIRVYGLIINEASQVLVSDEMIQGNLFTKFCGGGLELGEGTIDCVKREFKEEMQIDIEVLEHFYTTDFFQSSKFRDDEQVISIYYLVKALENFPGHLFRNNLELEEVKKAAQNQLFRWIAKEDFGPEIFPLPIDKVVAEKLSLHLK